jgi:[ribosomal protein S5]-alanine N-acetyltransferase
VKAENEASSQIRIESERLIGTPLGDADFGDLRRLHSDPRVAATLAADCQPIPEGATREMIARSIEHWRQYGFGLFSFRVRATGAFAGYSGIKHTIVEGADVIELAYAVRSVLWRSGYATEMSRAVVRFAVGQVQIEELVAFTLPHNLGSRRVMEACGFRYERDITHAGLPHVLYRSRMSARPPR